VKQDYPHALLLYRVGDFFETFFEDGITIARELELVLTSKEAANRWSSGADGGHSPPRARSLLRPTGGKGVCRRHL
jgi:hypothetical protein